MTIRDAATRAKSDPDADGRLSDEFRGFLLAQGADLVGFGSVSHMEGAPEIMQPRRYLPDALAPQQSAPNPLQLGVMDGEPKPTECR